MFQRPGKMLLLLAATAVIMRSSHSQKAFPQNTPMPQWTDRIGACHWLHGRLVISNGNPTYRLWRIGTHHVYGILSSPARPEHLNPLDSEAPVLPATVKKLIDVDTDVFGDYRVCMLGPYRKGEMQAAFIAAARHPKAKKY